MTHEHILPSDAGYGLTDRFPFKTKTYHVSNLGSFGPRSLADAEGYVTYHDDPRYGQMTDADLADITDDDSEPDEVRAAAATERAERNIADWQNGNR